jgi:hypothetical protein
MVTVEMRNEQPVDAGILDMIFLQLHLRPFTAVDEIVPVIVVDYLR